MSTIISQRLAVENATRTFFGSKFQEGTAIKSYATKEDQRMIARAVGEGILEGTVEFSETAKSKYATQGLDHLVTSYVMGMVGNWFNKSPILNGNTKYVAKNPGSRTNPEIKTLRTMLEQHASDPQAVARIQAEIDVKLAEIAASKPAKSAKVKVVDPNLVPDSLKDLLSA